MINTSGGVENHESLPQLPCNFCLAYIFKSTVKIICIIWGKVKQYNTI